MADPVTIKIPYTSPPSIGHEMGVMFGFIGFMLLCMAIYGVLWQKGNKRSQQKEHERVERLKASGLLRKAKEGGGVGERI